MSGNNPNYRVADFAPSLKLQPRCGFSFFSRVGCIWNTQVCTKHVDTRLLVSFPVVRQARHRVYSSKPHSRVIITQLCSDRAKALVEDPGPVMRGVGLGNLLPPVSND